MPFQELSIHLKQLHLFPLFTKPKIFSSGYQNWLTYMVIHQPPFLVFEHLGFLLLVCIKLYEEKCLLSSNPFLPSRKAKTFLKLRYTIIGAKNLHKKILQTLCNL